MPRRAKPLTATQVKHMTSEGQAQRDKSDGLVPGLSIRVSKAGKKTWNVSYSINGTNRRMKIGTYPATSLADARERARDIMTEVEDGEDPAATEEDRREGRNTFKALADEVLEVKARTTRESTQEERRRIVDNELVPAWGDRLATEVKRRDVVSLTDQIVARGSPAMANKTLSLIRLIFNEGIRRGFPGLEANPAHLVQPPGQESGRDRFLRPKEIREVWRATAPDCPGIGLAFRLALLTGQRMGAVAVLRWEDMEDGVWTIPASEFKGKRKHLVPLSPEAQEVIAEVREAAADDTWLFPSSKSTSEKPHLTAWNRSLERIRDRTDIPRWTVHDFRRTFRTHAIRAREDGGLGVDPRVADAVLGHKEQSVGFVHYQGEQPRYLLHEKREALEAWGTFVRKAVEAEDD